MNREAAQRYQADISSGLSQEQVQERIDSGWTNEMVTEESKTVGRIIKGNLLTYFNLIFAILAILVVAAGSFRSLTFLPVVIANLFIGILQEIRAKKTLDQLTMLNAPKAEVVRNGHITVIVVFVAVLPYSQYIYAEGMISTAEGRRELCGIAADFNRDPLDP